MWVLITALMLLQSRSPGFDERGEACLRHGVKLVSAFDITILSRCHRHERDGKIRVAVHWKQTPVLCYIRGINVVRLATL